MGFGARPSASVSGPVHAALAAAGLTSSDVTVLATIDRRLPLAAALASASGWRVAAFSAASLAEQPVTDISGISGFVAAAVGTPSVAEAAALLAAGRFSRLIMPKTVFSGVTVAIAVT
ncbi:cobalamin biosynthesis protein [Actinoplanes sp. NPDC051861]|uniref:cobalamin biosynthesis protein n=1 Tax=Actinoplanes sp. NPDC051861 TaxID=3155170 RepID=UPI003436D070